MQPEKHRGMAAPHIARILSDYTRDGLISLEIGCGGKPYRPFLKGTYYGSDMTASIYAGDAPDVLCSGEALPFKDASVDLMFTVHTLYLIPDSRKVLREVRRALKPGGQFLVFDYNWLASRRLQKTEVGHRHNFSPLSLWWLCVTNGFKPRWVFYLPQPVSRRGRFLYRLGVGSVINHLLTDSLIFCAEKRREARP